MPPLEKSESSHSTVARRIESFEKRLGVRVFDRLPTGYALTTAGEDALPVAERVEEEIEGLRRRLTGRDQELAGRIRVTAADFLATHFLMPALAAFTTAYPEIEFEVISTYSSLNLDKREADVALRFSNNPPDHLVGRRLATFATAPYATDAYIESHDFVDRPTARWVGFDSESRWVKNSDHPHIPVRGLYESLLLQAEAVRSGMGMGLLPCLLGDGDPMLRRVPPCIAKPAYDLWYLVHPDLRETARLRAFSAFLALYIKQHLDLIEGRQPSSRA